MTRRSRTCTGPMAAPTSRRGFLKTAGGGLGYAALAALLADERGARRAAAAGPADASVDPLVPRPSHYGPRATRVIQIFCPGGVSQVDTFDYKPELERRAGQPFDDSGKIQFFASKPGAIRPSFFKFAQHGESGRWLSELFPQLATCVDELAFIYSMQNKTALHGPGTYMLHSGQILPGFPSMGAWVTYGLGSDTRDLPGYVVLADPRGLPPGGKLNWGAGFLPAVHQGTELNAASGAEPVADLFPAQGQTDAHFDRTRDARTRDFLRTLNGRHAAERSGFTELDARIASYELAARLQLAAPEATDITRESPATQELYGLGEQRFEAFGRQCLLARRLVERGVRFVQVYCGAENTTAEKVRPNWDAHEDLHRNHAHHGPVLDRGVAALIKDLRSRGLLDETLVICTTEFGRQPAAQGDQGKGRDHNAGAFTTFMAGGGIRGGASYGATDDLGFKAVENPCYSYDLHATCLHLLGLDHTRLTYYHNGLERRLTDVHGHVLGDLLA